MKPFVEHLCQKNPGIVRSRLRVCCWTPSDRAFTHWVRPGLVLKQGFADGMAELSLCPRSVKGGGDDTEQILALTSLDGHQESLLPRLSLHFGHITDLIRDK